MARAQWPLREGKPALQIVLTLALDGQPSQRVLLADTGAGSQQAAFDLILEEDDCVLCEGIHLSTVNLRGAYAGAFPVYSVRIDLPTLGFATALRVAGVPSVPAGFDGIACFSFINRFTYGNFGDPGHFGLESKLL
jgi:hypothetical protein